MINLNKDNKKRRLGASMKIICTIIVTVALLAGVIAIGFMGYSSENKSLSELNNKINTAYENDYNIFIDGVEVQSVPDDILKNHSNYDFLSDDVGGNLLIKKKGYYNTRSITYVMP